MIPICTGYTYRHHPLFCKNKEVIAKGLIFYDNIIFLIESKVMLKPTTLFFDF